MSTKIIDPKPILAPRQIKISPRMPLDLDTAKLPPIERRARLAKTIDHQCAACLLCLDPDTKEHLAKVYFPEVKRIDKITISLIRVGKGGELIEIDKYITMDSDKDLDLQDAERHRTAEGGKAITDSRVTWLGKFLRPYWIDELPQIGSLASGDLSGVGIRPYSPVEFLTMPRELQQEYIKHAPGVINATFYQPKKRRSKDRATLEMRYLKKKAKAAEYPTRFDLKYVLVIAARILFQNQRGA